MDTQHLAAMPPLGTFYPSGYPPTMPSPRQDLFQPRPHALRTHSMESMTSHSDMEDTTRAMSSHQAFQRSRRKHQPGSEHVKHRRTRSGCYTCRQRRVKCDETRPICDRCRKGKRECAYPGTSSSSKPARSTIKVKSSSAYGGSSPSGEESDEDGKEMLDVIPSDDPISALDDSEAKSAASDRQPFFDLSGLPEDASISPSMEPSTAVSQRTRAQGPRTDSPQPGRFKITASRRWSTLPRDVKMFLRYYRDSLSHHHYGFTYDGADFLKTDFLAIAMDDQSQSLLYAIVAFASYHHTLRQADARISNFLAYYNKSIVLLQQSLKSNRPGVTTLLTILQLATIEELLGDWVNLLGHQRAAHQILTDLFTPQTIMQDETRRQIIAWYIRFDLLAGMMSGNEASLNRDWAVACQEYFERQARNSPEDLGAKFGEYFATSRLLATDAAILVAAKTRHAISDTEFVAQSGLLLSQFTTFGRHVESLFTDPSSFVKEFPNAPPTSDADIADYRDPNFLYSGELFTMNYVLLDLWALDLMFRSQVDQAQGRPWTPETRAMAVKICKMVEAIQYCDEGPPGAILCCQTGLGAASLFLPRDQKHINWCRHKFALIEQHGYIYPAVLRERASEAWGVDVRQWWLPNNEGYPAMIRAVRDFIEYRARVPAEATDAHVRDMNAVFHGLDVVEFSSDVTDSH